MLPIGKTTAIRRIIITLQRAGVGPIVVITGDQGEDVEKHISKMRVICLRNEEYASSQMFDSICMGLNYIEDLCDRVLIMPVKVPMLLSETIENIMKSTAPAACPVYNGKRGHPVMLTTEWIPRLLAYRGEFGLRSFLREPEIYRELEELQVKDQGIIIAVETDEDCKKVMESPSHRRIPIHGRASLFIEGDESFFGPEIAHFLELIDHTGSMQTACRQMHMSYTKGWKLIKTAEQNLGYPMLFTQSGGAEGGFSQLTPKTKEFLNRFLAMERELTDIVDQMFDKYFID
jgi:molybdate transport repressor ModE-like protein